MVQWVTPCLACARLCYQILWPLVRVRGQPPSTLWRICFQSPEAESDFQSPVCPLSVTPGDSFLPVISCQWSQLHITPSRVPSSHGGGLAPCPFTSGVLGTVHGPLTHLCVTELTECPFSRRTLAVSEFLVTADVFAEPREDCSTAPGGRRGSHLTSPEVCSASDSSQHVDPHCGSSLHWGWWSSSSRTEMTASFLPSADKKDSQNSARQTTRVKTPGR